MKNKHMLGNLLLLLTAMIWGTAFVAQRVGMDSIEPITFNASRMALAAVMVGALAYVLRQKQKKEALRLALSKQTLPAGEEHIARNAEGSTAPWRNTLTGGICCGLFLTAGSVFQQMGVVYTSAGKAGFITAMYMLFVPIINYILFKKKLVAGMAGCVYWCRRHVPAVCERRFHPDPGRHVGLHLRADVQRAHFMLRLFCETGKSY